MTANPSKRENSGKCFSGLLQRFLCPGSLQTYPSDNYLSELDKIEFNQTKAIPKTESSNQVTPGVVARLMGLDSMPDLNCVPIQRTSLDWTMRSRSVGYADYLPHFGIMPNSVRRVRTSVSFREVPSYLNQSNRDFVVLCFDKDGEISSNGERGMRKMKAERRKNEKVARERNLVKKRETHQEGSKKASGKKVNSRRPQNFTVDKKDDYRKPNGNLKEKSPLKPLDYKEKSCLRNKKTESVNSHASTSGAKEVISRKKLPRKGRNIKKPGSNLVHKGKVDDQEVRAIQKKAKKQLFSKSENEYYSKMSLCILRLTEKDTGESKWSFESRNVFKFEDVEVVCAKLGEEIFQNLLDQMVNELN